MKLKITRNRRRAINEPSFYQLLQIDAHGLWAKVRTTTEPRKKTRLIFAMSVRSILLVSFAIVFIGGLSAVFDPENSGLAVAGFCILLGIKHVPYGYRAADSVIALGLVLAAMVCGGLAAQSWPPVPCLMVNLLLIALILVLVADDPRMGNAGIYVFGYLFVSQTPVEGTALASRCVLALLLWLACGAVLLHKHHGKFQDVRLHDMLAKFNASSAKGLWRIRLSAGVAVALLIGELAGLPRGVWVGYACMSVLLPFGEAGASLPMRGLQRIGGVVVGSLLYAGFSLAVPPGSRILFGPIAGICMGFSTKYMVNNALNCFGALLLAESIYGVAGSVTLRIVDNMIGVLFAICCTVLFSLLERHVSPGEAPATNSTKPLTHI
ncbi:hypothetical protein PG2093B_0998 [Bifidobacterium pseudolongum subsp. globosum]|uniref:Integral membrane bound transporter domain-containing protein n=1 Tax=Bifidobacterium pseudolongum subsp. globosum TaxID=1690 RepID=A0A4Q5A2B2_9BIFI|nr:FUSC family protein [Bifidobacterium pseudolongum]RYQ10415.1 hypothetical protein PG2093B_0998 [Bifidobacterium pseudolongum subsp. globosum]